MTLQSTINNSADDHSKINFAESDPKINPLVATHNSDINERKITDTGTTKGNSPHKLLTNRKIPAIVQGVLVPVTQMTVGGVLTSGRALYAIRAVFHKEIITGAMHIAAGVFKYPPVVNWKDTDETIPVDRNIVRIPPRTTTQVWTGTRIGRLTDGSNCILPGYDISEATADIVSGGKAKNH